LRRQNAFGEMKSQIARAKYGLPGLDRICAASQTDCFKNSKEAVEF